jgi:hypothetical protein
LSSKETRFHILSTPSPIYLYTNNERFNKPFFLAAIHRIPTLLLFQNIHFIVDLSQTFYGKEEALLVTEVTSHTSHSKDVDEVRAAILADVIKRDFLKEILRERRTDEK